MKKLIMALALIASIASFASTDVYEFKTKLKYPAIGKTSFIPASTPASGTLTIDSTNATAKLELTLKKPGLKCTMIATNKTSYAVFGKKDNDIATTLTFVNVDQTDGLIELTFYGWGSMKTKTTGGCTPCGDTTESCSRPKKLTGVVGGKYICPCGGTFAEWDGSCEIGTNEVNTITVLGSSATFTLQTVDGQKWK